MARKRFISSDISTDEELAPIAGINPTAALMWPWFLTAFDDWGRMEGSTTKIKLSVFPAFPFTSEDIDEAIRLFQEAGLVHVYYVDGKRYLAVEPKKFYYYQSYISEKRKADCKSLCPEPVDAPWNQLQQNSKKFLDGLQDSETIALHITSRTLSTPPTPPTAPSGAGGEAAAGDNLPGDNLPSDPMAPVCRFFFNEFTPTGTRTQFEHLEKWVEDGMEPDLLIWAMEQALLEGKRDFSYLQGIIRKRWERGIRTRAEAEADEEARHKARDRPNHGPDLEATKAFINKHFGDFIAAKGATASDTS